ncbi:MAG: DUF4249 domain-containing protein [Bacteroidia bacterium]|nr:DUF4249 domain-containing protein [Bacteroidia bacterium]
MKKAILCILLSFSLFYGCTKEAKVKLPPQEDKLVVTSFISPNDYNIIVTVRNSTPKFNWVGIWGPQFNNIADADIFMSDGSTRIRIPFDSTLGMYRASTENFPIISKKTYYLDVRTRDGKNVTAETTVPTGTLNLSRFEVEQTNSDNDNIKVKTLITIPDLPETTYITGSFDIITSPENPPTYLNNSQSYYFSASDEFQSYPEYVKNQQMETYGGSYNKYIAVAVTLLNCDKNFYLYHKTIRIAPGSGDNPFSDPVMVYTNINGGFGCFGSYIRAIYEKEIR